MPHNREERIVVLDSVALPRLRRPGFPHRWTEYENTSPDQIAERLCGATIAIVDRLRLKEEHLSDTLRLIAVSGTGLDHVDVDACRRRGIRVSNVQGWAVSVPEHVFALILLLQRGLLSDIELVRRGEWSVCGGASRYPDCSRPTLRGSTLGVVGFGWLGRAVSKIAKGFGMSVLIAERKSASRVRSGRTPFLEVLRSSAVLVLAIPLNAETYRLIGAAELSEMRSDALLINCARGGIVDEGALARSLLKGQIAGAALDVLCSEPPMGDNPLLDLKLPNLVITPHVAWFSDHSLRGLAEGVITAIESFVDGSA